MPTIALIEADRVSEIDATIAAGAIRIGTDDLQRATGWELKPQGLCQGDICIPLPEEAAATGGEIDLAEFAALVGRPLAVSTDPPAAYLGPAFERYQDTVRTLEAPDFVLPDLEGRTHSLHEHRGSKVLLVAWASW